MSSNHTPASLRTPQNVSSAIVRSLCGFLFPSGDYLLVVDDDHSRCPDVEIVKYTAATAVIPKRT